MRKALMGIHGVVMAFCLALKAMAVSESNVIYVREIDLQSICQMVLSMIQYVWKDILSIGIASVVTVLMTILAIWHKNSKFRENL